MSNANDIDTFGSQIVSGQSPDISQLVQEARPLVSAIESTWTKKKLYTVGTEEYPLPVQTYRNGPWVARVSNHPESHDAMLEYIAGSTEDIEQRSHTAFEKQYMETLSSFEVLKVYSSSATSTAYTVKLVYLMPFPLNDRVFFEMIVVDKSEDGSEFFVISLPIPPPMDSQAKGSHVLATYHSIEWVKNGKWIMCTRANSGGMVPKIIANASLPTVISHDVEAFFNFVSQR